MNRQVAIVTDQDVILVQDFLRAMEKERIRMRNNIVWLFFYMAVAILPLRIGVDTVLDNSALRDVQYLRKYAIIIPFSLFIFIGFAGVLSCFARRFPKPDNMEKPMPVIFTKNTPERVEAEQAYVDYLNRKGTRTTGDKEWSEAVTPSLDEAIAESNRSWLWTIVMVAIALGIGAVIYNWDYLQGVWRDIGELMK